MRESHAVCFLLFIWSDEKKPVPLEDYLPLKTDNKIYIKIMKDSVANNHPSTSTSISRIINIKLISYVIGILLWVEGGMFLICMGVSLFYQEDAYRYFLYSSGINLIIGGLLMAYGKGATTWMTRKDGYCIVTFTWLMFTLLGMLPFWMSGEIPSVTDAFYETMSGFTTTGATILDNIESLSHGMLFWRSLTQWIGGLGILCFTIALLPIFGVGNLQLFSAEATGVTHDKVHPKISTTTQLIWTVYILLTGCLTVLLYVGGMQTFDAVCHSLCTMGTGGYSTKQASVAFWNSPFIEYVIAVFMILAGVNYSLLVLCLQGKFKRLFKDDEIKWYLGSITVLTVIISVALFFQLHYSPEEAFRKAFFQVVTLHTSCGFATDDYTLWPQFTWMLLLFAMIAGGCTGSTAGGIKNMRIIILYHNIKNEFKRLIHPNAMLPVRINKHVIPQGTVNAVTTFTIFYFLCGLVGCTVLLCFDINFLEAFSTVFSSLGNIGPALGDFGPSATMSAMPEVIKWLLSFLMLIGRLELFSVLLLFSPVFWKEW